MIYGSLSVITALRANDLIDEYHLLVHPIAIGQGTALFPDDQPRALSLLSTETYPSGVVLMRYEPCRRKAGHR